jgi:drug/metabolite transporter (DMT)-like permease
MTDQDFAPAGAFAGCTALWGTTFLAIRLGDAQLPPLWAATIRLALACVLLVGLALVFRQPFPRRGAALRAALWFGALEFGANLGLLYWAERDVPSGLAAVFYATAPLTAAALAHFARQERLDGWRFVATLVAFGGVLVAFAGELGAHADLVSLLAVLLAAVCAAAAGIALRRAPEMPVLPTNAIGCGVGAAVLLAASLLAGERVAAPTTWSAWAPILYLTAAGSLGAFTLYTFLVNRWGTPRASLVGVTVPIAAVVVGGLVAGERIPPLTLVGGALVLAGVVAVVARARHLEIASSA